MDIRQLVKQRILILDGAIGTMIQGYGLSEGDFRGRLNLRDDVLYAGNNDMLCLPVPISCRIFTGAILRLVQT